MLLTIPLAPRTGRRLDMYIDERTTGPIFPGANGQRIDRYAADRTVKRLSKRSGITPPTSSPRSSPEPHVPRDPIHRRADHTDTARHRICSGSRTQVLGVVRGCSDLRSGLLGGPAFVSMRASAKLRHGIG